MVSCRACKTSFEAGSYRDELCPGCGALVPVSLRLCPCCTVPFERRDAGGLAFDECARCGGVFLDHQTQQRVFGDKARAEAVVAALSHTVVASLSGRPSLACPACADSMQRKLSDSGAGVVLDVCAAHGTFFDGGKLPAIIEFIRKAAARSAAEGHAYAPVVSASRYRGSGTEKGGEAIFGGLVFVGLVILRLVLAMAGHH